MTQMEISWLTQGGTVTRYSCDSVILLLGAKNSKFEFFWREKFNIHNLGPYTNFLKFFEVASSSKHPQKLVNATKVAGTSNFSFPAKNSNLNFSAVYGHFRRF